MQHLGRVAIADAVFHDVVQDAGDEHLVILPVSREDYGDVGRRP